MKNLFDKENFRKRLSERRKLIAKTQKDIAAELGISDKTYSKWETGEGEPDLTQLCCLAEILSISPAYLLDGDLCDSEEAFINSRYDNLSPAECLSKSFELQFYTIRGLAKRTFAEGDWYNVKAEIPPNRVRQDHTYSATSFSATDTYHMMYNGKDANISLSIMPAEERMSWLTDRRERLSQYLSFIGGSDFLRCLRYMMSADFSVRYSADYLADKAGLSVERTSELLEKATELGICWAMETNIGTKSVKLYSTNADHMLSGILTLAYISLPEHTKNGHYYWGSPGRHTMSEGE